VTGQIFKEVTCRYVSGHGVASGRSNDLRFPKGTLSMQAPYFLEAGLNLSNFHHGTLNLTPIDHSIELISPKYFFSQVKWTKNLPAENFSFFQSELRLIHAPNWVPALLYWPHPSTKPEFHQPVNTYEFIAPYIHGVLVGALIKLRPVEKSFRFEKQSKRNHD